MMAGIENRQGEQHSIARLIVAVLVFGSIWGFLEATLGGYLHLIIFPNKGAIMAGIGVAVMSAAFAIYRKPAMLPGIGVVAASFKLLSAWFFVVPVTSIHIVNPVMAIIFESLVFSAVIALMLNKIPKSAVASVGAGVLAGIISAVAWVYFAIYVMNAPAYNRVLTTAPAYITNQGVIQAVFFGIFVPLGILIGEKLATQKFPVLARRPVFFGASAAIIVFCWVIGGLAILAGL